MRYMRRPCYSLTIPIILLLLAAPGLFLSAQTADPTVIYKQGMEQIEAGKFEDAYRSLSRAHELDGTNAAFTRWLMNLSVYLGQNALFAGDHDTAIRHFTTALTLKKELSSAPDGNYTVIQRLVDMTKEHAAYSTVKPEYVHKFLALYIKNTDLKDTVDALGKPVIGKGSMADNPSDTTIRGQNMLKFYIETLSKGRLSLSFERKTINTTLTRANIYSRKKGVTMFRPDFNSTTESLGPSMFESKNKFDTMLLYFINRNFKVWCYANAVPVIYIPYTWYGKSRGAVTIPLGGGGGGTVKNSTLISKITTSWVLFHEYFHVIERISGGIGPTHGWLKESIEKSKKSYPAWVPDMNRGTAAEYSWYRYHVQNTVPRQMEKKAAQTGLYPPFKNFGFILTRPDRTDEYVFQVYTRAVKGISLANLRTAAELLARADKLRQKKKIDEAVETYKKVLEYNPHHHKALLSLGRIALGRKDTAEADRRFSALAKIFPDPREFFSIAKSFFDRNDFALSAKYFRVEAEGPGRNPVYAWWLSRALTAAGDGGAAQDSLKRIEANPLVKIPASFIDNRGAGQALYSTANPEDESSVRLAKPRRQDGFKWKLLPSGEADYVLIVSDYSWKCLEARGAEGDYVIIQRPIDKNDAQKWRLAQGSDGLYRIMSKISGTPLAISLAGKGKKPALTLQEGKANAHQYWDIRTPDSALNDGNVDVRSGETHGYR